MQILSISPGHKTNRSRKICDPQLGRANSSSFSRIATTPFCFLSLCSCTFMRSANAATLNRCCRSHVFLAVVQLVAQFGSQSSHVCVACQSIRMWCEVSCSGMALQVLCDTGCNTTGQFQQVAQHIAFIVQRIRRALQRRREVMRNQEQAHNKHSAHAQDLQDHPRSRALAPHSD